MARALAADPDVLLMDEPFGAVDPIVRTRLQDQFLAIQAELAKTVVLVTHDIEEAVRLGDRVAVFEPGGRLAQFDTPARVLGGPADEFVAEFVGADRGLRRLAVTPIAETDLELPPSSTRTTPGRRRKAIGGQDARWAVVLDDQDNLRGWVSLERQRSRRRSRPGRADGRVGQPGRLAEGRAGDDAPVGRRLGGGAGRGPVPRRADAGTLHEALRRSVSAEEEGGELAEVEVSSTGPLHV